MKTHSGFTFLVLTYQVVREKKLIRSLKLSSWSV